MNGRLCRIVIGLAAALYLAAIALVTYILVDLALNPTDMPLMYLGVPPLTAMFAGGLLAWYWVFIRARAAGDEQPAALGWGAGAALLAPALSVGVFTLLSALVASVSARSASMLFSQWLCWVPVAGLSAVLAAWLMLAIRGRRAKHP